MPSPKLHRALHAALAGCALAYGVPAQAQSIWEGFPLPKSNWSAFSGFTFSDNVTRSPDGPSDTTFTVGASGSLFKDEGRLYANVRAALWYEEYLQDTFDGELLGSLGADLRYDFIPERFSWSLENTYGQTTTNTFAPASPGNRTNANFFSTGPNLTLPFGDVNGLRLSGRYGLSSFDDSSQLDEERISGEVALFRRFAPTVTGSINASLSETTFQDGGIVVGPGTIAEGYDIRELFGRMEARRARYTVSFDAGVTEVEQRGVKESSPLYRLNFYRRLSPSLNLNLGARQEYRSGSDILGDAIRGVRIVNNQVVYIPPGVDPSFVYNVIADVSNRNQPVRYQNVRANLDYLRPRTTVGVYASTGQERVQFSGQSLDRDVWEFGVNGSRRLRPNLTATLAGNYYDRKFVNLDGGDEDISASFQVSWQYTSQLAFNFGLRHSRRDSDADDFSFDENIVFVGLTYGPPRQSLFAPTGSTLPAQTAPGQTGPTVTAPSTAMPRTGP